MMGFLYPDEQKCQNRNNDLTPYPPLTSFLVPSPPLPIPSPPPPTLPLILFYLTSLSMAGPSVEHAAYRIEMSTAPRGLRGLVKAHTEESISLSWNTLLYKNLVIKSEISSSADTVTIKTTLEKMGALLKGLSH